MFRSRSRPYAATPGWPVPGEAAYIGGVHSPATKQEPQHPGRPGTWLPRAVMAGQPDQGGASEGRGPPPETAPDRAADRPLPSDGGDAGEYATYPTRGPRPDFHL